MVDIIGRLPRSHYGAFIVRTLDRTRASEEPRAERTDIMRRECSRFGRVAVSTMGSSRCRRRWSPRSRRKRPRMPRRRGQPGAARPRQRDVPRRHRRAHAAARRPGRLRARPGLRAGDLHAAEEPAGPRLDARNLRADLRDLQDLSDHPGQVHPDPRALHRRRSSCSTSACCCTSRRSAVCDHPALQPRRHRRQLRRRVVRHPRQHLRQLPHGVRRARGQAVSRATRFRSRRA